MKNTGKSVYRCQAEGGSLIVLSVLGFLIPNGVFLYSLYSHPELAMEALKNPVSAVFIGEACFLMLFAVWILGTAGVSRTHRMLFVAASLIGSLACSIPAALHLLRRRNDR